MDCNSSDIPTLEPTFSEQYKCGPSSLTSESSDEYGGWSELEGEDCYRQQIYSISWSDGGSTSDETLRSSDWSRLIESFDVEMQPSDSKLENPTKKYKRHQKLQGGYRCKDCGKAFNRHRDLEYVNILSQLTSLTC